MGSRVGDVEWGQMTVTNEGMELGKGEPFWSCEGGGKRKARGKGFHQNHRVPGEIQQGQRGGYIFSTLFFSLSLSLNL